MYIVEIHNETKSFPAVGKFQIATFFHIGRVFHRSVLNVTFRLNSEH